MIQAISVVVGILAGTWILSTCLSCNLKLLRRQLLPPFGLGLFDFFHLNHARSYAGCIKLDDAHQLFFPGSERGQPAATAAAPAPRNQPLSKMFFCALLFTSLKKFRERRMQIR